jgi:predicted TIM-barrel fold metal-dependent hydrolase
MIHSSAPLDLGTSTSDRYLGMKLDIYSHILPERYFRRMCELVADPAAVKRWLNLPVLHDLDARLRMMDTFEGYQQVLTLSSPPIEYLAGPEEAPALARLANETMAELVDLYPERFPAFVASLPMNNTAAAVEEIEFATQTLDARGVQIFTNVNGRPLDDPAFWPVFETAYSHELPIWMHPARGDGFADYASENRSQYEIWWALGWPYETSAAMARLVFSGTFDRLEGLKVITHHMGAMIPYLEGRIGLGWADQLGSRTADERENFRTLRRHPLEYFREFYADTSLCGSENALKCGLGFFGTERTVFGTDCPFDPEGGPMYIRETIRALDHLELTHDQRSRIYVDNARALLKLGTPEKTS